MHLVDVGLDDDGVAGRHHYHDVSRVPAGKWGMGGGGKTVVKSHHAWGVTSPDVGGRVAGLTDCSFPPPTPPSN